MKRFLDLSQLRKKLEIIFIYRMKFYTLEWLVSLKLTAAVFHLNKRNYQNLNSTKYAENLTSSEQWKVLQTHNY